MHSLPERKRVRLKGYDYSTPGAYFITICTQNREHIFDIESNDVGNALCGVPTSDIPILLPNTLVHKYINELENKFDNVKINKYVIMPNHIHAIIVITERHAGRSLPKIVGWFKAMFTYGYMKGVKDGYLKPFDGKIWQKSYHDHIIRDEKDYSKIWEYIDTNPGRWEEDCFYNQ